MNRSFLYLKNAGSDGDLRRRDVTNKRGIPANEKATRESGFRILVQDRM
ncbi:hypothetical protein [Pedobacter sp. KBW06]|nr:hypothetical protein [Pedobacter sp. KBW06]